jgi:hypothetical protein
MVPRIRIHIKMFLITSFGTLCSGLDPCDIVPSDYVLSQLESLGQILSYCLVEGGQAQGGVSATPSPLGQSVTSNKILKGLGHEIEFNFLDKNRSNANLYWF